MLGGAENGMKFVVSFHLTKISYTTPSQPPDVRGSVVDAGVW